MMKMMDKEMIKKVLEDLVKKLDESPMDKLGDKKPGIMAVEIEAQQLPLHKKEMPDLPEEEEALHQMPDGNMMPDAEMDVKNNPELQEFIAKLLQMKKSKKAGLEIEDEEEC